MRDSRQLRLKALAIAGVALVLFVPRLTAMGMWDPSEVKFAESARALAHGPWSWAAQLQRPPLPVWIAAAGARLGLADPRLRFVMAGLALLALFAVYWAGRPLAGARGAWLGTLVLATMPELYLGARQLTSVAPLVLGAALAVGGLVRALRPAEDASWARRWIALALGVAGLAIGQGCAGVLVGIVAPVAAVVVVLALDGGPAEWAGAWLVLVGLGLAVASFARARGYSPVLGGTPHLPSHSTSLGTHLVRAGYQLFPWIALSPMAIAAALDGKRDDARRRGGVLLIAWTMSIFVFGTLSTATLQDLLLPLCAPVALLVGAWLDELVDEPRSAPFAALVAALAVGVVAHDLFVHPQPLVGAHFADPLLVLQAPHVAQVILGSGGVVALALAAALAAPGRLRNRLLLPAFGCVLAFALVTEHFVVPKASSQLAAHDLDFQPDAIAPRAPVAQYKFDATGLRYYSSRGSPKTLDDLDQLLAFLGKPERVLVWAGRKEQPSIDAASRQRNAPYFVVDDSNPHNLLLSNRR